MKKRRKRNYTNGKTRLMSPPAKYQENFINRMDERTEVYHNLDKAYQKTVSDLGGVDNLSRIELSLIERFIYIEMLLRKLEVEGQNGDEEKFLERYIKLSNSLNSVSAKLGVSKRSISDSKLKDYLQEQEQE